MSAPVAPAGAGPGPGQELDPVYEWDTSEEETDSEADSEESFDMGAFDDEENVMGADFKLSGIYGRVGMLCSGLMMTFEAFMVVLLTILFFRAKRYGVGAAVGLPIFLCCSAQTLTSYLRGVELFPLVLYPTQIHYFLHTVGGLEIGQQTLRFSGIRYIQGALQSGPILLVMSVLMLDLDNNPDPGRAENKLLGQLGGPLLVLTYTFAAINVLIILAADLKPKKTRVSRLKPVDTCGVSIKERSTVLVVSACEVVSSTFLFALLIHVQGAQHAALYMLAFYALLVFGWRWWTRRIKDRKGVFLFALVFSIPNMLGSFFTAGDAETSFIYQFRGPLRMTETEFLRSGVWMPDFLALHVLRMGGMVALILLSLRTTFSEALMPSAASDGGALAWQNSFAISVVACLCALNAAIALHFELKRRGVLAWGRAAQSRMLHRARMDEKKRRHRERFDAKLGSSSEEDADPEERARRARVKRRALLRRLRSKPCIVRCPILCLYRATDVLSDCLACGCCIRARERQRKRRDKERKKREKAARRARRRGEGSATAVGPRQAWCWRLCCCGRCSRNTVASEAYSVDDASDATSRRSSKASARSAGSKRSSSSRASRAHPPAARSGSSGRTSSRGSSRAHSAGTHRGASERGKPPSDGSAALVVTVAPSNPATAAPGTNHSRANSAEDTKLSPSAHAFSTRVSGGL